MSKKSRLRRCFNKRYGKRAQTLFKSREHYLYHVHWSLPSQIRWKKPLLLRWKTLGLLVNTLAADLQYPLLNRDNLTIPIQMQLSQKQKTFSQSFSAFSKSRKNFKKFWKKDDPHGFVFPKLRNPKTWLDKYQKSPVSD